MLPVTLPPRPPPHSLTPQRRTIIELLLDVLATPSEAVQRAVSNCLPRLVAPLADERDVIDGLLSSLLAALKEGGPGGYGLRRGAAYGLAGAVKGLGEAGRLLAAARCCCACLCCDAKLMPLPLATPVCQAQST